jgi:hypothetical protein
MATRIYRKNEKKTYWRVPAGVLMIGMWWDWNGLRPELLDQVVSRFGEGPVTFAWAFAICLLLYPLVKRVFG